MLAYEYNHSLIQDSCVVMRMMKFRYWYTVMVHHWERNKARKQESDRVMEGYLGIGLLPMDDGGGRRVGNRKGMGRKVYAWKLRTLIYLIRIHIEYT